MKQKFWQLLPAILFFLLFAVLLVLLLFGPRETRSLTEGRALAGRPVMDLHDPAALTQAFTGTMPPIICPCARTCCGSTPACRSRWASAVCAMP